MMRSILIAGVALFAACQSSAPVKPMADQATANAVEATFDRPGFVTKVVNGRLWVFQTGSKEYDAFLQNGEPTVAVNRIGAGPEGMTLRAPDFATIDAWQLARPGFVTRCVGGRIWVFADGSKEFAEFCKNGEPTVAVNRIGAGPNGETVRAPDFATIDAWLKAL